MRSVVLACGLSLETYLATFPKHARVIIFDLETTGLDPKYDEIVEIGAIELTNLIETRSFSQLANPSKQIPEKVSSVHGLNNYLLRSAPSCAEVLRLFMEWVGPERDFLLVGHNLQFDVSFLKNGVEALNASHGTAYTCDFQEFCTFRFVEMAFGGRVCSLNAACRLFGIYDYKTRNMHSALVDCRLTGKLFAALKMWDFFLDTRGIKQFPPRKVAKYLPRPQVRYLPFTGGTKKEEEVSEEKQKVKEGARKKFAWMRKNWHKPEEK